MSLPVTSKVLCQTEKGRDSLHFVFVGEDGEEDTVHRGSILKDAHGAGSAADLAEAAFDGVGGSHRLACGEGLVAKASEKLVEIVAQAGDGGGVGFAPALGEAAGGRARFRRRVGVHDGVQVGLDGRLVDLFDLVEDVADLVRPAALDRDLVVDHGRAARRPSRRRRRSCRGLRR